MTKIAIIVLGHSADTLGSNVGPLIQQKVEKLLTQTNSVHKELRTQSKQFMALQEEVQKILEKNQELKLPIQ